MKPLTIDELKSLEVGDWVWLVYKNTDYRRYAQIQAIEGTRLYVWGRGLAECEMKQYSDYGKTWLAYKNKEQAEANGEIVELPSKVGDTVWVLNDPFYVAEIFSMEVESIQFTRSNTIICGYHECEIFDAVSQFVFKTKEQAERRLAELKGEKV